MMSNVTLKPTAKELLYIVGTIFAGGMAWGSLAYNVNAQGKVVEQVPVIKERVIILETKQDYMLGLLEYQTGIRTSLPSRPKRLSQ